MSEAGNTEDKDRGDAGEEVAATWLISKGYKIIERNHKRKWGEIDIVASRGRKIHFVEVKTAERAYDPKDPFGPLVRVGPEKQKRFARIITTYLLEKRVPETQDWQVDVVLVYLDNLSKTARVEIVENVLLGDNG